MNHQCDGCGMEFPVFSSIQSQRHQLNLADWN